MIIKDANDGRHKYIAYFNDGTATRFGSYGMSDYTQHKDKERRRLYRIRHAKDLLTHNPKRAGYLSYYLLWNKPTLEGSLKDYIRRFGDL